MISGVTDFAGMARAHLSSAAADRLIAVLRPGIQSKTVFDVQGR
jgi:hypothetical protein